MKTGIIIYVVGGNMLPEEFDEKNAIEHLHIQGDRVEMVVYNETHFDINYAWWNLITKGMHRVICKFAQVTNHSKLQLTGREFQLCAY